LPFIKQGKPVFNVEYNLPTSKFCTKANEMKLSSIKKKLDLTAYPLEHCAKQGKVLSDNEEADE